MPAGRHADDRVHRQEILEHQRQQQLQYRTRERADYCAGERKDEGLQQVNHHSFARLGADAAQHRHGAGGRDLRADAETNPDLFWALRGGGGNFGVVTAVEFRLFPIETVYAGWLVYDGARAAEVLRVWSAWSLDAPDEVTTSWRVLNVPPIEEMPPPFRGRTIVVIDGAVLADDERAAEILRRCARSAPRWTPSSASRQPR